MMWITWQMFLLKVATINFALKLVMDSLESSVIGISYNNIGPWLP